MLLRVVIVGLGLLLAGCAAETPPPETERVSEAQVEDGQTAVLDPRERTLRLGERSEPAGVGPTQVISDNRELMFVLDSRNGAVLLFHTRPRFELTRRAYVPGGPVVGVRDSSRRVLWIALRSGRVAEVSADGRPRLLRTLPGGVRDPTSIEVRGRRLLVTGAGGQERTIPIPPA